MTVPARTPIRKDAIATRERLVRAALELFTTTGYRGTTTLDLAARADLHDVPAVATLHDVAAPHLHDDRWRGAARVARRAPGGRRRRGDRGLGRGSVGHLPMVARARRA